MPLWPHILFLTAAFSTLFCAAVNAYTYQIAYPLWASVGPETFPAVHREYMRRLHWIITVPHIVMFFSAAALVLVRPPYMPLPAAVWLFVLEALVVVVSAFGAGPIHTRFTRTGIADEAGLRALIRISLLRVILMTVTCGIFFRCLLSGLRPL